MISVSLCNRLSAKPPPPRKKSITTSRTNQRISKQLYSLEEEEGAVDEIVTMEGVVDERKNCCKDEHDTSSTNHYPLLQNTKDDMVYKTNVDYRSNVNACIATFTANLAAISAGCVLTWSSPTLPKLVGKITKEEGSWLSSLVAFGAVFGPFIASSIVDKLGRKWTIMGDMMLFLLSWAIIGLTDNIQIMYFARFLAGIAVGCVFTILPMYVAEISPMSLRGTLGSLMQLFLSIGFCVVYIVGPYTSYLTLVIVSSALPLLALVMFAWLPESPYHLVNKGRKQAAFEALQWLRGYPKFGDTIQIEISEIQKTAEEAAQNRGSCLQLFSKWGNLKSLYYACTLVAFQQFSGVNVVLFYSQSIFYATGSSLSPSVSTIIVGLVLLAVSAVTVLLAKLLGVRVLLILSAIGEAISLTALGIYFYLKAHHIDVSGIGWLPITSLVFFIITYGIGFGPFVWVVMAEIFPSNLKAFASAIVASFCWVLCFILTLSFRSFTAAYGESVAFWAFAALCILSLLFVVFQLPDTDGKSFQEIQEIIHGKPAMSQKEEKA